MNQVDDIRVRVAVKIAQLAPITSAEVFERNLKVGQPSRLITNPELTELHALK